MDVEKIKTCLSEWANQTYSEYSLEASKGSAVQAIHALYGGEATVKEKTLPNTQTVVWVSTGDESQETLCFYEDHNDYGINSWRWAKIADVIQLVSTYKD